MDHIQITTIPHVAEVAKHNYNHSKWENKIAWTPLTDENFRNG